MGTSSHAIEVAALISCASVDGLSMSHELCIMDFIIIAYMHESSNDIGWRATIDRIESIETEISDHK
jgi:hypothetical protein